MPQDYKEICHRILDRIKGIDQDDLTTAESQIARILMDADLAYLKENNCLERMDPDKPYRVSWFSAHRKVQHFDNLSEGENNAKAIEGKDQQFKVVVTRMSEPSPTKFGR